MYLDKITAGFLDARLAKVFTPDSAQAAKRCIPSRPKRVGHDKGVGMHTSPDSRKTPDAAKSVLALAKKLHRAAQSDGLSESLPVLRRLLNASRSEERRVGNGRSGRW